MASCKLCASLLDVNRSETRFTNRDEAQSHAAQHLLQTKHFDDKTCSSLDQVFEQCFPNFNITPARKQKKIVVKKEGERISGASPRATCQKCGSGIILYGGRRSGRQFGNAINHASSHLGIDLFECRQCGRSFYSKNAVRGHLISSHGLRSLSEYFTDKSGDFVDEISNSIEQCFTEGDKGPSEEKPRMIRLKNEANVRSKTKGSKLAIERQLFCYRLIRQLAGDDGTVQCRLCPKRIYTKQGSTYRVQYPLEHALVHLKKPMFRCKVCSSAHYTRPTMLMHLKSAHALPLMNNYDSLADEFHADILDMLRKCYAEEPGN